MKKILTLLVLFVTFVSHSQITDLASLSNGDVINFNPLKNENIGLVGYLALFDKGDVDKTYKKFEYVFLDKNLNKVFNKEFVAQKFIYNYYSYFNDYNQIEMSPYYDEKIYQKTKDGTIENNKIIDYKTNEISDVVRLCLEDEKIMICDTSKTKKERSKEWVSSYRKNKFTLRYNIFKKSDDSFIVFTEKIDPKDFDAVLFDMKILRFDKNKIEKWRYEIGKDNDSKNEEKYFVLRNYEDDLIFVETKRKKDDAINSIVKMNINTGEKEINEILSNDFSFESLKTLRKIGDNFYKTDVYCQKNFKEKSIFVGEILAKNNITNKGFFRVLVDKKNNKVDVKKFIFTDASQFLKINEKGKLDDGNFLTLKDIFVLKDGSVNLLFEKIKGGVVLASSGFKYTDLVLIQLNSEFKVKDVITLEKDKSTSGYNSSDYLYSQYINDNNDVVFYYRDYQKNEAGEKNWTLYINSIIGGEFKQEKINISSKDNLILPYLAKDGYILLREFNKKTKFNEIRLERLNH